MSKVNVFRKYVANSVIMVVLLTLISLTYVGGALGVFSSSKKTPIFNGNLVNKNITMMINVYWGTEFIEPMLDVLDTYDVKTTFFVGGTWVSKNNDMTKLIYDRGHEIGNHGYYHKNHNEISKERNYEEIKVTHELVKAIVGVEMNLFAPPSGAYNATTIEVCESLSYKTIMWTEGKDTIDWRDKNTDLIYNRAIKNPKGGDLILMHPTANTLAALPKIIEFYKANGFNLTTVSENLK